MQGPIELKSKMSKRAFSSISSLPGEIVLKCKASITPKIQIYSVKIGVH